MLQIGMLVEGRYKILREIGRGGTSCVYLAENIRLHNYWAIKEVYKSGYTGLGMTSNTLITESNILTKLRHSCLPTIIDVVNTYQSYLIIMEYIDGISLDKVLAERGNQSQSDVIKWAEQLCDVLEYLHNQIPAIIYRDMKPANIMLKPDGNIVLIDFGMAREFKAYSRHDTTSLGTHGYAAPEQYRDNTQTDARTDIYSLGVTLYHLVTGQDPCLPPYGIRSIVSLNPSLSPKLDAIITKCTQFEPSDRFQSANEMKKALSEINAQDRITVGFEDEPKKKSVGLIAALTAIPIVLIIIALCVALVIKEKENEYYHNYISSYNTNGNIISDDAALYFEQYVYVSTPDERMNYSFVPEKTGYYSIYSYSESGLPIAWVIDSYDNLIGEGNVDGSMAEFDIMCYLSAGETYYLQTTLYDLNSDYASTGDYMVYVEYQGN